ncbi:MAG: hypothetical protein IJJ33_04445 [Victivallales bacterium]|nr:hypothetical protein [Victivallales bacterium]
MRIIKRDDAQRMQEERQRLAPPRRFSKYRLKLALERLGVWESVKEAIVASGHWEDVLICGDFSMDDKNFTAAVEQFRGMFPDVDVEDVLAEAQLEE